MIHFLAPSEIIKEIHFSLLKTQRGIYVIAWVVKDFKYVLHWVKKKCLVKFAGPALKIFLFPLPFSLDLEKLQQMQFSVTNYFLALAICFLSTDSRFYPHIIFQPGHK